MKTYQKFLEDCYLLDERFSPQRGLATFSKPHRKLTRREVTSSSIIKRSGLGKGTGKLSPRDLRTQSKEYSTYDSEDPLDDIGSTKQDTHISSYINPRSYANKSGLIQKLEITKSGWGSSNRRVKPSKESVRRLRALRRQLVRAGVNTRVPVHTVDILPRDPHIVKGDPDNQMERGRNFFKAIKNVPKHLKAASVSKRQGIIIGPSHVLTGEGRTKEERDVSKRKRASIYSKIFGNRLSKLSNTTGKMVGKIS